MCTDCISFRNFHWILSARAAYMTHMSGTWQQTVNINDNIKRVSFFCLHFQKHNSLRNRVVRCCRWEEKCLPDMNWITHELPATKWKIQFYHFAHSKQNHLRSVAEWKFKLNFYSQVFRLWITFTIHTYIHYQGLYFSHLNLIVLFLVVAPHARILTMTKLVVTVVRVLKMNIFIFAWADQRVLSLFHLFA